MKRISTLFSIATIVVFLASSCQKANDKSRTDLIIKASTSQAQLLGAGTSQASKSVSAGLQTIVLDTFLINIEDIKFEISERDTVINKKDDCTSGDDADDCSCDDKSDDCSCNDDTDCNTYDDIEAEGPYLINILSPEVLDGMVLDSYSIPNAIYDEVEFEITRYRQSDNKTMTDRSIYLAGTINGNRFQYWTNLSTDIEIEFPDQGPVSLNGENIKLYIDISLGKIQANLEALNLTSAIDRNNNGCIEIGNNDTDGNTVLSRSLLKAITGCFDLDDENDDD
jgi:hypothetical protein